MMYWFSIVIITHNEENTIEECIQNILDLSDDIIVVDAESTDRTCQILSGYQLRLYSKVWEGYGAARNFGQEQAHYEWIFTIDADERCTQELKLSLHRLTPIHQVVYLVQRQHYFSDRPIHYGYFHPEWKWRLYPKSYFEWDLRPVHEDLHPRPISYIRLKGKLYHYLPTDLDRIRAKQIKYALLSRHKYKKHGLSIFRSLGPYYHFINTYFIQGGFLEGYLGWKLACIQLEAKKYKYRPVTILP